MLGKTFKYQHSGQEENNLNQLESESKTKMLRNDEIKDNGVGSLLSNQKQVLSTMMKNEVYTTGIFSYSKWRDNGC